jgi:hypothetical protein
VDERSGASFKVEVVRHDPKLQEAFAYASGLRLAGHTLARVGSHSFAVYLIGKGGSLAAARALMHAVRGLLRAGGCAVKVESAGTAHSASDWTNLCASGERLALLQAFVAYAGERPHYHSCGMHNLGLRDATIDAELDLAEAGDILSAFTAYLLLESPMIEATSRFRLHEGGVHYSIEARPCGRFPRASPFYNPIGVWHLTRSKASGVEGRG